MSKLLPNLKQKFTDEDGAPYAGGKLYSYVAGTTTPTLTYTDESETVANTNPIILDSSGSCDVWITQGSAYKFRLTDADDVEIFVVDDVVTPNAGADGNTLRYGSGAPNDADGVDGNFYYDPDTRTMYGPKSSGVWPAGVALVGNAILNGSGAPAGALGTNGDFYVDNTTKDFYGPKTAGAWGSPTNLYGPAGADGTNGTNGTNGIDGIDGVDGVGVPAGGTAGQILAKIDGTDFNTEWTTPDPALPVGGTAGQLLAKLSGTDGDADWVDPVAASPLTTKGDLYTFDTDNQRLAVGTNGHVLTADSAEATGMKWSAPYTNPMNASGDIIYGGVAGVATRLAKGSDGDVLSLASGVPAWSAPVASSDFSTGDVKLTLKTSADSGWVMFNDGTIGNASSGGTSRANADTEALFTLLWNNITNAYAAVSGGRGASAAADFAANKTLALPKVLGRALAAAGSGASLTARSLGQFLGTETHTLTESEMPSHTHTQNAHTHTQDAHSHGPLTVGGGFTVSNSGAAVDAATAGSNSYRDTNRDATTATAVATNQNTTATNQNTGGGAAHNNMQPTLFLNVMVKL